MISSTGSSSTHSYSPASDHSDSDTSPSPTPDKIPKDSLNDVGPNVRNEHLNSLPAVPFTSDQEKMVEAHSLKTGLITTTSASSTLTSSLNTHLTQPENIVGDNANFSLEVYEELPEVIGHDDLEENRALIDLEYLANRVSVYESKLNISNGDRGTIIFTSLNQKHRELFSQYVEKILARPEIKFFPSQQLSEINNLLERYGIAPYESGKLAVEGNHIPYLTDKQCLELGKQGFDINFIKQVYDFNVRFKEFPAKYTLSIDQDELLDQKRLGYVKDVCTFVLQRKKFGVSFNEDEANSKNKDKDLEVKLNIAFQDTKIDLFVKALAVLTDITGGFRHQFKKTLQPEPFTWETFEHLGGILQFHHYQASLILPPHLKNADSFQSFFQQIYHRAEIIRWAFNDICADALPNILSLVTYMDSVFPTKDNNVQNLLFSFPSCKALISTMINQETLSSLLILSSDTPIFTPEQKKLTSTYIDKSLYMQLGSAKPQLGPIVLDTKMQKHHLLNRLIEIGELCTGKYLSSDVQKLQDNNHLFKILVAIRDALIHQEIGTNRIQINTILAEGSSLLSNIFSTEIPKLFNKFFDLTVSIYSDSPNFKDGAAKFWKKLYDEYNLAKSALITPINYTSDQEKIDQEKILTAVGKQVEAVQLEEIRVFFQGRGFLSSATEKALKNLKTYQRVAGREKLNAVINATRDKYPIVKPLNLEQDFPKLLELSRLFEAKNTPSPKELPSHIAKQAILDIKEVLLQAGFDDIKSSEDWVEKNEKNFQVLFSQDILQYQRLNALKYNIQTCLHQLDIIMKRAKPDALDSYQLLGPNGEQILRPLRNFLVHGNRLIDIPNPADKLLGHLSQKKIQSILHSLFIILTQVEPELEKFVKEFK